MLSGCTLFASVLLLLPAAHAFGMDLLHMHDDCETKHNISVAEITKTGDNMGIPFRMGTNAENCLYWNLLKRANDESGMANSLAAAPNFLSRAGQPLKLQLSHVVVTSITDNNARIDGMKASLHFELTWVDERLSWSPPEFDGLHNLTLMLEEVWHPKYTASQLRNELLVHDSMNTLSVSSGGLVTYKLPYNGFLDCDIDFSKFPRDVHTCCLQLSSTESHPFTLNSADKVPLTSKDLAKASERIHDVWQVQEGKLRIGSSSEFLPSTRNDIMFCIRVGRISSTLRLELSLPVMLCVVVVLLSPFFGNMTIQSYVKLFSLLLQMLCLDMLSRTAPRQAFAAHTPNIYRFYEMSITMTLISLVASVVLNAMGRMPRKTPPPHSVYLAAAAVNARMCCSGEAQHDPLAPYVQQSDVESTASSAVRDYRPDWLQVYGAANSALSFLLWPVYCLFYLALVVF